MKPTETDKEIRDFIANHIDSLGVLEVLLLLNREKYRYWSVKEVGREMRSSEFAAIQQLNSLHSRGLVIKSGESPQLFSLARLPALDEIIKKLSDIYASHRTSVISLIYDGKANALQSFADAFIIKKDG